MGFKICAIGCGRHATWVHGPSFAKYAALNPDVELAACCDTDPEKAGLYSEKFGFKHYYTDLDKLLECEKPDAVSLVVPLEVTAQLAERILEKGYPLIMEKPPGRSGEEVRRLIKAADKNNVRNRVAFNRRYSPLIRDLKGRLEKNFKPGDIQSISYNMIRIGRRDGDFWTTAIHAVDAVRYIAGIDYKHVRFRYREFPGIGDGVACIYMDCIFPTGTVAQININPISGADTESTAVYLNNHIYLLELPLWNDSDLSGSLTHMENGRVVTEEGEKAVFDGSEIFETGGFYYENASFFDALRSGKFPEGHLKSSLQSVEVAYCIQNRIREYHA